MRKALIWGIGISTVVLAVGLGVGLGMDHKAMWEKYHESTQQENVDRVQQGSVAEISTNSKDVSILIPERTDYYDYYMESVTDIELTTSTNVYNSSFSIETDIERPGYEDAFMAEMDPTAIMGEAQSISFTTNIEQNGESQIIPVTYSFI